MRQSQSWLIVIVVAVSSCNNAKTVASDNRPLVASRLEAFSLTSRTETVGSQLAIDVQALTLDGIGVPNVPIAFTVVSGGGLVSAASAVTDSLGHARITWTLGDVPGANQLEASLPTKAAANVLFSALAVGASRILVRITQRGNGFDADGYDVSLGNSRKKVLAQQREVFDSLARGMHTVRLSNVAAHCFSDTTERRLSLTSRDTVEVTFDVECYGDFAFVRHFHSQNLQIYYVQPGGSEIQLTSMPGRNFLEDWAPDGARILFTNEFGGNSDVYSVRIDGTGLARLTSTPAQDSYARWSPDGQRIVFERTIIGPGHISIHTMNADGSGERRLLDTLAFDLKPSWSPNGAEIVFSSTRFGGNYDLCTISVDGTSVRRLVSLEGAQNAGWSSDGSHIAFMALAGGQRVWVTNLDGSVLTNLTPKGNSFGFEWSPDGSQLILAGTPPNADPELMRVNKDGTMLMDLYAVSASGWMNWSRDGAKVIADLLLAGGRRQMVIMNPDGTRKRSLDGLGDVPTYRALWNPKARPGLGFVTSAAAPDRNSVLKNKGARAVSPRVPTRECLQRVGEAIRGGRCETLSIGTTR